VGTNITDEHRRAFEAIASGGFNNFALMSCFYDGEPTAAVVCITSCGEEYDLTPIVVFPTERMLVRLKDHDNRTPELL